VIAIIACGGSAAGTSAPAAATSAPATAAAGGPTSDFGGDGQPAEPGSTPAPAGSPSDQQLIVYEGTLSLEVGDLNQAVDQADQLVAGLGGHVASSQLSNKDNASSSSVTYRIPAERWDDALTGLRAIGTRVVDENTTSEDVTGQVVDLDARIANLRASESALQAIMARASSIPDVLNVQDKLTSVQGDIESMTAQRDSLANRAALSTLTVDFNVPVAETTVATGGWDLGHEVDNAAAALLRLGQGLTTIAVWLVIVVLPVVVPLLILLLIGRWLRRRWLRAHPHPVMPGPPHGAPPL
jgi:hypothetical protein